MITTTLFKTQFFESALREMAIKFSPRFLSYTPKHRVHIETGRYLLKTATSTSELLEVFKLRHNNFLQDDQESELSYDLDEYDHICDHLIIICKESQEIIGTYRLICSLYSDTFYSQGEFKLERFLKLDGVKLELGRACIDMSHRNGNVIDLLWKGIAFYAQETGARYLFGCSSVSTIEPQMASNITNYLRNKNYLRDTFEISPTKKYQIDYSGCISESAIEVRDYIPSLLMSYICAGAKVHGLPALDKEFECIDYFTILDLDEVSSLFKKRYFKWLI